MQAICLLISISMVGYMSGRCHRRRQSDKYGSDGFVDSDDMVDDGDNHNTTGAHILPVLC